MPVESSEAPRAVRSWAAKIAANAMQAWSAAHFGVIDKRIPGGGVRQGAGMVQFACKFCGEVDNRVQSRAEFGAERLPEKLHRVLLVEVRLDGDHLLVQDTHDHYPAWLGQVKHDVLALLKPAQAWEN